MHARGPRIRKARRGTLLLFSFSILIIAVDASSGLLATGRAALATIVSPVVYVAQAVRSLDSLIDEVLVAPGARVAERRALGREIVSLRTEILELEVVSAENRRLRGLLGGVARLDLDMLVTDVIAFTSGPAGSLITIDVGRLQSVQVGDPVVDGQGICGQVVSTGLSTSQVLQVTDPSHSVPVVIERTGVQGIVSGTGVDGFVELEGISVLSDVKVGDVMVTSGLGGRFPYGYPVAEVVSFIADDPYRGMRVYAEPLSNPAISRQLIVLRGGEV